MDINVHFYSYFKDLAGCSSTVQQLPEGGSIEVLVQMLATRFPGLAKVQRSTLVAVGVDYQDRSYVLKPGDEVSLFPPVQGG